ncbi:MAG: hypothetical protein JO340_03285 [Acidobacteriaceae bacterium]|nr:hypothetical protein [Acidobacteriaceae bacterium]
MATNPGIGPTGPHEDSGQAVSTGNGTAAQTALEETGPSTEKVESQPVRDIGPTGPRKTG